MVGGAMSGYWDIGNVIKPRMPRISIRTEMTVESTGLSMNLLSML
jgi:hypothetical protein